MSDYSKESCAVTEEDSVTLEDLCGVEDELGHQSWKPDPMGQPTQERLSSLMLQ